MQIADLLRQTGGLDAIARELGISETDATRGAEALAPVILGGFKKAAGGSAAEPSADGVAGLGALVAQLGGASLLDDVVATDATHVERGNGVLGRIFGSRDVSRDVVADAAARTGLDESMLARMLPRLAMLIAGYLGSQATTTREQTRRRELGVLLGGVVGRGKPGASDASLASVLDLAGSGKALDEILDKRAQR